jgi:glycosyltransferase involved in cell wall biosynthesis
LSRILHLIASDSIAGPEKQLLHHARNTRNAAYEIVLGSFQDQSELPEMLSAASRGSVETVSIPGGVRPGLVDDLSGYLRRHSIDLLCTHENRANVVGHFAAKHAQVPWVPFVHGFADEPVTLYARLEHNLLMRSRWVVCTSATQARELAKLRRGRPAPIVIPNAVLPGKEIAITRSNAGDDRSSMSDGFVFGSVGRLNREKGHRILVEAFAALTKALPDQSMELLILGEGPEEASLRTQARRLGIEPSVCFAGFQSKTASWMKGMDCLVHPSLTEGGTNSVLDAMLLGIPVIASGVGVIQDIVQNGQTGLLVEAGSSAMLLEAMKKIAESASMRKQLVVSARRRIQHDFSPARQRSLLESVYENALGGAFAAGVEEPEHVVA